MLESERDNLLSHLSKIKEIIGTNNHLITIKKIHIENELLQ